MHTTKERGKLMTRIRKQLISWLLVAALLLCSAPAPVHAEVLHKLEHTLKPSASSGQWVNPKYADLLSRPQTNVILRAEAPIVTTDDICHTLDEAAAELRQGMVERMDSIEITFSVNADFDATNIWDEALKHTGKPKEGDYLLGQLRNYAFSAYYNELGDEAYFTYVFKPGYLTTAEQEQQMDAAVAALLQELDLASATDFEKIKGIYDWICGHVTYDYDNLNNKDYYLKHSAYAALINRTAVCQGFAVLFYRLALELGVDCRYITGTANGGSHAWNIVRLGDLYYNLDATWDQPLYVNDADYEFFLRCGQNFVDHARDDEYAAAEFYQAYPMSPEDYGTDISWPVSGTCGDHLTWVLDENGVLTISGTGNMYDFYAVDPEWQQYSFHISKIVVEKDVQSVGAFAFYYCANLKQVEILGSAVLCESAFSYCVALEQVSMPNVLAIHDAVFYGCNALRGVHLPASLQQLGNEVFFDCVVMQTLTVDPGNPYFTAQNNVLFNKQMTQLYVAASLLGQAYSIPESVVLISAYAFRSNPQLRFITIPQSVTQLPEGVFYGCTALRSVSMADSLQQIGDFAFYGCTALEQAVLPAQLRQIGTYSFCATALSEITIPASVSVIGYGAFDNCSVSKITFTGRAPEIHDDAFANVFADVYYPSANCDNTWENMTWDYGGFLQWYPTESHSYIPSVTAPTCEEPGYTTYTCGCGHSYIGDNTEPAGHMWDDGEVTQAPTDTEPGKCTYTCIVCDKTRVEDIPPTTHEHSFTSTLTPPTCTEQGFTTHKCNSCNYSYVDTPVDPTGHSMSQWTQITAPGCETAGEEHSSCANCDYTEKRTIAALQHSFTNYVSDNNASCGKDGTKTAVCDRGCGKTNTITDAGSAKEHQLDQWTQTIAPTCDKPGEEQSICAVCGKKQTRQIPTVDHSYSDTVTAPTCTEDGFTTHKCGVCGHSYQDTPVPAKGHDMGDWQIITQATTEAEGLKRRTCRVCSHMEEQKIPVITGPSEITSDVYAISGETVGAIGAGTTVSQFLSSIHEASFIKVFSQGEEVGTDALIATGMEIQLVVDGQVLKRLTVVVTGDINGDGKITLTDMLIAKALVLKKTTLTGAAAQAADTNNDQNVSITDYLQIKAQILGKSNIKPHG